MNVLAPLLRATPQRWKNLARIEAHLGVERVLHAMLDLEICLVELIRHEVALLESHTMLARQHSADIDAQFQNLAPRAR